MGSGWMTGQDAKVTKATRAADAATAPPPPRPRKASGPSGHKRPREPREPSNDPANVARRKDAVTRLTRGARMRNTASVLRSGWLRRSVRGDL